MTGHTDLVAASVPDEDSPVCSDRCHRNGYSWTGDIEPHFPERFPSLGGQSHDIAVLRASKQPPIEVCEPAIDARETARCQSADALPSFLARRGIDRERALLGREEERPIDDERPGLE